MSLKDALIASKLAGGGGSGNLPTPSAANYGDSLVVGKQYARGAAIVPEQTVVIDAESEFYIAPLQGSLLSQAHEGDAVIAVIDGVTYSGRVGYDGPVIVAAFGDDEYSFAYDSESEQPNFFFSNYPGEHTVSLYAAVASYEYALDPYAAYDVVIRLNDDMLISSTVGTVDKGDITAVEAKGLAGVPITVLVYGVQGDPAYPYTKTLSVVSCYWDNYDTLHENHFLAMVIADFEPWNARVCYRELRLYTTGDISFTEFMRKVDLVAL